jgi:hypothetical protein
MPSGICTSNEMKYPTAISVDVWKYAAVRCTAINTSMFRYTKDSNRNNGMAPVGTLLITVDKVDALLVPVLELV